MSRDRRTSGLVLPRKAALAPVNESKPTITPNEEVAQTEQSGNQLPNGASIPRDYFNTEHLSPQGHRPSSLARVTELLHKTVDASSSPSSPRTSAVHLNKLVSPMSSSDSLASLIERQTTSKINHPGHQYQLFNSTTRTSSCSSQRKRSSQSIFNLWPASHKRTSSSTSVSNSSVPLIKSPLHLDSTVSRKLAPNVANPHHVHNSPSVKESKKVYLEYDPVSRKKVLNTYEIVKEIGRGEHGKVKLAKEIYTEELVAIKIVDRRGRQKFGSKPSTSSEEKVRREIAIMKKLSHPNIVQLKEVMDDVNSRKIYLVLEYLEKGEIKWQKSPNVPLLTLPEAMKVFRDVVLGLEYLHYQGIIHRDIKPANLLIASNGAVKISDFGVSFASSLKDGDQDDYDLAKTAGTPAFMAPELCLPITTFDDDTVEHPKITHKIDIWALGVTLYCLLFGAMPFWARNEFELFKVICSKPLEFPETFPTNYEWSEEDKEGAKDLLVSVLEKDPTKRSFLKEVKKHPFVLKQLSEREAILFSENQKSCDHKIEVSNDEVQVAVIGIASKIRKGFARALKMAGIGKAYAESNTTKSNLDLDSRSTLGSDGSTIDVLLDKRRALSSDLNHKRTKSGDAAETKTTVEGDLFLNKHSALSSLSHIMNDDRRRSSISSSQIFGATPESVTTTNSSSATDLDFSNDSLTKTGSQLVSLPMNASFASLDSVYLDNYAPTYVSTQDSRRPPSQQQQQQTREVQKKMSGFSLNKKAEKKIDEDIAPHEPPPPTTPPPHSSVAPTFNLSTSDSEDRDADDESEDGDADDGFGFFIKPTATNDSDRVSELSVPSGIAGDLAASLSQMEIRDTSKSTNQSQTRPPNQPTLSYSQRPPINGPKYSFFETSDTETDTNSESDFDTQEAPIKFEIDTPSIIEPDSEHENEYTESDSEDEDDDKLVFSFGNRGGVARHNSISTTPFRRPATTGNPHNHTPNIGSPLFRKQSTDVEERVSSPLAKDAPKTPVANANAHLLSHFNGPKTNTYVNHYNRSKPICPFHVEDETHRGRANSITVGILTHEHDRGAPRASSQPI